MKYAIPIITTAFLYWNSLSHEFDFSKTVKDSVWTESAALGCPRHAMPRKALWHAHRALTCITRSIAPRYSCSTAGWDVDRNPGSSPGARWWLETKSWHASTVVAGQCSAVHVTTWTASSPTVLHEWVMSYMNESYLTCMRHVSYKSCIARHTRFVSHMMQSS